MADIAEIGFRAETSELIDAKAKLDALPPSAGKAERSADRLAKMFKSADSAVGKLASAATRLDSAAEKLSRALDRTTASNMRKGKAAKDTAAAVQKQTAASRAAAAAARDEAAALNQATQAAQRRNRVPNVAYGGRRPGPWGMPGTNDNRAGRSGIDGMLAAQSSPSNIAAQFQDIGVTAAMGMNPLLIALQQGTQLSMAFAGGIKGIGASLKLMLGPTALLTIALVGLLAAGLQMIDWIGLAKAGLMLLADNLPIVTAGIAALGAMLLYSFGPAILSGIISVTIAIASGLVAAIGGLVAAIGAIPIAIGLIIADLIIFRDAWAKLLGFDLIAVVKTSVNYVIGAFVGGYKSIKSAWSMLPAAMGDIILNVANNVILGLQRMINKSIEMINGLVSYLPDWMRPEGSLITWRADFGGFENEFAGSAAKVGGIIRDEMNKALGEDYVGIAAEAITNTLSNISDKIRGFASGLGIDKDKKKKKSGGKTDAEKFDDIVNGAERTIASLQAERDAIGLSEEATARLRYQTDLLNEAKQKGIDLSPKQREQLLALAADMARLEIETKKVKEAIDFAKDITKGFFQDFFSGIREGKSVWESFGDAALNVLNKIADKLLNEVLDALFQVIKVGGGGGGGGFLGGFLKLLFNAKGNAFGSNGVHAFANGGSFTNSIVDQPTVFKFAKGIGVMGEAGPEAVLPLKRTRDGSLGVQTSNGNNSTVVSPVFAPSYTVEAGATQEAVEELYKLRELDRREFPNMVATTVNDIRRRNGNI